MNNTEKIMSRGLPVQCDLVGSHGVYTIREKFSDDVKIECRIRSVHYKPVMKIGQLLEMEGPYFLVQDEHGKLLEIHFSNFQIVE